MKKTNCSVYLRHILSILLIVYSAPSVAELTDNYSLAANFASYHLKRERKLNEFNPGLGLRYSNDSISEWGVGFYRNSFNATSVIVTYSLLPIGNRYVRSGAFVGLVTGYPQGRVLPSAGLQMQIIIDRTRLNIGFIPPVKRVGLGGVFAFQFLYDF